jgi:hypothetical protein
MVDLGRRLTSQGGAIKVKKATLQRKFCSPPYKPMTDPITAATIAALAANKFVESGAGEVGKRLIENLWSAIANRFQNDDRAKRALVGVETEQSPEAIKKLEFYLDDEMTAAPEFADLLKQLVQEIQAQQPAARQEMATNLELEGDLTAKDMVQRSRSGQPIDQTMLKDVKAQNINLGNLSQD